MSAFAGNSADVSFVRRLALRAAIFLVFTDRTAASFVRASVDFVCHKFKFLPLFVKNIPSSKRQN
jgi:hypothetical protein